MPLVPSLSPATGDPTCPEYIHTLNGNFVDSSGRTLLLRGVNLSGSSKAPVGQPSYLREELWEAGERGDANFIGRPLNLDDGSADIHLARLRGWGFNMLRFPVTWEALEHDGPGKYDYDFMDYTIRVLQKCQEYGFRVFMDPHQDIWSRYSGGSGAPYWTLLACGINPRNFTATQSAILHSEYPSVEKPDPSTLPAMIWSTNYGRLASQTLYTLFFAGRDYAPKCIIDGKNIQDYLQSHFIAAFGELADRIRDASDLLDTCVIGWDSLNEPAEGFCGWEDLNAVPAAQGSTLRKGSRPTPAQSLRLGMGQVQTVEHWAFGTFGPHKNGTITIDPKGYKMWLEPADEPAGFNARWGWRRDPGWRLGTCIWALHGVWDVETGYMVRPDYFQCPPFDRERPVVFVADYWRPHWRRYVARIREAHPEAIHFVQPPVFAQPSPPVTDEDDLHGRGCYSAHYYDGLTLVTRHWNWFNADALGMLRGKYSTRLQAVKIGERAIRQSLQDQLGMLKRDADILGAYPTLIGEIGIPFDMDSKRSYGWTDGGKHAGDYSSQEKALDASLNAADGPNTLNYTIWTYCPDSTHEWGDGWNMEDLSLWSKDDLRSAGEKYDLRMRSSSATLLKAKSTTALVGVNPVSTAASSSMSLATLGSIEEVGQVANVGPVSWENLYEFLTDGARAVRAFARPYPTAVVGVPTDIAFDIGKAEFTLTVRVTPEDGTSSSPASDSVKQELLSEVPTEIYVPLVHFAAEALVPKCVDSEGNSNGEVEGDDAGTSTAVRIARPIEMDASPSGSGSLTNEPQSATSLSSMTLSLLPATPPLVDLEVDVSAGRWEVDGQTLRWWYPIPAADASANESDVPNEVQYTIRIRRARGPIKTAADLKQASSSVADGLWNICERMCPIDACCVM